MDDKNMNNIGENSPFDEVESSKKDLQESDRLGELVDNFVENDKTDKVFFEEKNDLTEKKLEKVADSPRNYKKNKFNKAMSIVLSVLILVLTFVLGYITSYFNINTDASVAAWATKKINQYAYFAENKVTSFDLMKYGLDGVLNDPYAALLTPEESLKIMQQSEGKSKSIGMTVGEYQGLGGIYVLGITKGSPAEKNGIKVDYRVVTVDGQDFWDKSISDLTPYIVGVPDNTDITIIFAIPTYSGTKISHDKDNTVSITVKKEEYIADAVRYYDNQSEGLQGVLDDDTAFIQIYSFVGDTANQFDEAMKTFKANGKKKLILDLRDNLGGSDTNLKAVASHLIKDSENNKKTLILSQKFKDGSESRLYTDDTKYLDYGFEKIIVLINGNTASASEALLLAMRDYKTVDCIIGTTTFGKGTGLQTHFMPSTNYAIRFTVSYFFSPLGNTNEKIGIEPTNGYRLEYDVEGNLPYTFAKDNQFMRAVNYLK